MNRYFVLNKPFNMVSQFVSSHEVPLLGDLKFTFPEGTHAIGRLDKDSEGLLLLTTNKTITRRVFLGDQPHRRTYLLLVQNIVSDETLEKLRAGINIRVKNGMMHTAIPVEINIIQEPLTLCSFARDRREAYPHTWISITLTEGKFHQIRKMVLAVKHRCLRLIRLSMERITIEKIMPGEVAELPEETFLSLAGL